ncbi:MAG: family hydrolase [Herminiimonas sp.]|nr:family hydrolase [Herminiimonas sp.]
MQPIKAILFDLDDTLWPIAPVILQAENLLFAWLQEHAPEVARRHSIDALRQKRMALLKSDPRHALDLTALRHNVLREAFEESGEELDRVEHAMAVFIKARNTVAPFDDVHPVLTSLKPHVLLGSVSNGPADLEAIGMAHYFSFSIAAHSFGRGKPDPAIFHAACEQLGVAPGEAAYVGDDPALDVEGAQKAGLHGIWLDRSGTETRRKLPDHIQPDVVCTSLHDVQSWFLERNGLARKSGAR